MQKKPFFEGTKKIFCAKKIWGTFCTCTKKACAKKTLVTTIELVVSAGVVPVAILFVAFQDKITLEIFCSKNVAENLEQVMGLRSFGVDWKNE